MSYPVLGENGRVDPVQDAQKDHSMKSMPNIS